MPSVTSTRNSMNLANLRMLEDRHTIMCRYSSKLLYCIIHLVIKYPIIVSTHGM